MPKKAKKKASEKMREHVEHALKTHAEDTWRDMGDEAR
eukprot:COSAG02_NODE_26030_length_642_cov_25.014733_1_plen_37_part_10